MVSQLLSLWWWLPNRYPQTKTFPEIQVHITSYWGSWNFKIRPSTRINFLLHIGKILTWKILLNSNCSISRKEMEQEEKPLKTKIQRGFGELPVSRMLTERRRNKEKEKQWRRKKMKKRRKKLQNPSKWATKSPFSCHLQWVKWMLKSWELVAKEATDQDSGLHWKFSWENYFNSVIFSFLFSKMMMQTYTSLKKKCECT